MKLKVLAFISLFIFIGCTIYRSPQKREFESESPQFRTANLKLSFCSHQSVRTKTSSKRLVTIFQNSSYGGINSPDSEFLWEYLIDDESIFESDNLKGDYCVYQNN